MAPSTIDILILTALREEYEQVLEVDAGAFEASTWQLRSGPLGHEVAFRTFTAENGLPLEVAVTWATSMGGVAAAGLAERVIAAYAPRCLAMCGVCAGRRGDTNIGDVIVADRLWMYDTGKLKVELDDEGKRIERVQGDLITYNLRADWKKAAEAFGVPESMSALLAKRPRPIENQADWVLERILKGEDPRQHADIDEKAADFAQVLDLLWKKKLLEDGTLELTTTGKKRIDKLLLKHFKGLPDLPPFQVRVGPIGTGDKVVQDPQIFDRLSLTMRKVLGLEMEAMAIGAVTHDHQDTLRCIVMKAVMDYADDWKSDAVKQFAARASAECLIAFLRKHLPPVDRYHDILDPGTAERPSDPAPSALLHAKHRYISFYEAGRADILARLRAFCVESERAGVWLIHGDGGMGKTRLMIEFCERLRKNGWAAGFLRASANPEAFENLVKADVPACVVIDYAESRPNLAALLEKVTHVSDRGAPLRIVLLARNAGDWWTGLQGRSGMDTLLSTHAPEALEALVESKDRADVVERTAQQFADEMGKPMPMASMPDLKDIRFERALYLHLAALAWVENLDFTADSLMDKILRHEEDFWLTQANALHDVILGEEFVEQVREAVAAMTLSGGITSKDAGRALLHRLHDVEPRLLAFLHRLYPGKESTYTSALEPDLLGEGMVWRTMGILQGRGDSPTAFLDKVFKGESDRAFETGFGLLGRLSVDHERDVRSWIRHLLSEDLAGRAVSALEAAKALGVKTAHAWLGYELAAVLERSGTPELARRLERAGIPNYTVSLREVQEWVSRTVLTLHTAEDGSMEALAERARRLNDLGNQQSALGQREVALQSTQEAVAIYRKLAAQRPDMFLPDLAASLNNLGVRQSDLGQRETALVSTQEAVDIYRKLAAQNPDTFLPDLAMSLNNLGNRQNDLGQHEAALHSTHEAVNIRRKLAARNPETFLPNLATSLNNLGAMQRSLGQRETALRSTQEAVDLYRKLAEQRPDMFLPNLAGSLTNLGEMQSNVGQREAGLDSTQEAVDRYRKLAAQRPDTFLPDLAKSLNNLGNRQSDLGQHDVAMASTRKAVDIWRKLAAQRPDTFLPDLAMSLNNLGVRQSVLGQYEAALVTTKEAMDIRRKLAAQRPDTFLPYLAGSLNNLGNHQSKLGQTEAALRSTQEAVNLYRKLADQRPGLFLPDLAMSLDNLGTIHTTLRHHQAALEAKNEARHIFQTLAERSTATRLPPGDTPTAPLTWTLARNIGPIQEADVLFGDLTILVGPQATGKSVFLQLFKLCIDAAAVQTVLRRFNIDWPGNASRFFEQYFGEGMGNLWTPESSTLFGNGMAWDLAACATPIQGEYNERVFFIPAQRVLSLRDGLTRPFTDYRAGDPFVLRHFSDTLHRLMQTEFAHDGALFPRNDRLHASLADPIANHVFGQHSLRMDAAEYQKRLVLGDSRQNTRLPYLVWSAGQREFVPLLMGLYWLFPVGGGRRAGIDRVVIEEIEMGLHPKAISATMTLILELMRRGYRVCLSTHSPHVLDVVWALQFIQQHGGTPKDVRDIFGLESNPTTDALAENALRAFLRVHYFPRNEPVVDISELDPGSDSNEMAGWGGLTEFSGHVGDIVARVARREDGES